MPRAELSRAVAKELLARAFTWALQSRDPSTQVGAVFMAESGYLIGGYNRVHGKHDSSKLLDRDWKYANITHAEVDVLLGAAVKGVSTQNGVLACTWAICDRCARSAVAAGIKYVITHKAIDEHAPERWQEIVTAGRKILADNRIRLIIIDDPLGVSCAIKLDGKLFKMDIPSAGKVVAC